MSNKSFVPNLGRFQIMTDTGFSDFIGVTKTNSDFECLEISIQGASVKVTKEHEVFIGSDVSVKAEDLKVGDYVHTNNGPELILKISESKSDSVYDILEVKLNHRFYVKSKEGNTSILIRNCLYIDELAFVQNAEEFYESVYPVITSSDTTKVIITSTPKGLNYFYKMWTDAETMRSEYVAYNVLWNEHPERNQEWYNTTVKNMNARSIDQEIHCVSGDTYVTINGKKTTMESLYNKYTKSNSSSNKIVYFNDVEIAS